MQGNSKSRKMSDDEVRRLIAARVECNSFFTTKFYDRNAAWTTIREKAGLATFTVQQIKAKWSNLTTKYKLLVTPPTGGVTENGEQTPGDWEFFDQLHDFMSTQHTINPPLVVNSCGIVIQNSHNTPNGDGSTHHDELNRSGPSWSSPDAFVSSPESGSTITSPEAVPSSSLVEPTERGNRRRKRYSQQDMFEFFVRESERKKKEGKKFLAMIKCIAQSQNIAVPNFDSTSSSESDINMDA